MMRSATERQPVSGMEFVLAKLTLEALAPKSSFASATCILDAANELVTRIYRSRVPTSSPKHEVVNASPYGFLDHSVFQEADTKSTRHCDSTWVSWLSREKRVQGLREYLDRIEQEGYILPETNASAIQAWSHLNAATQMQLPVPDASAGPEGMLLLTWDRSEHHLELEFSANTPTPVFFYLNRENPAGAWELEYEQVKPLQQRLLTAFRLLH